MVAYRLGLRASPGVQLTAWFAPGDALHSRRANRVPSMIGTGPMESGKVMNGTVRSSEIPWDQVGDLICGILTATKDQWPEISKRRPGVAYEQLAAAVCAEAIEEMLG